MLRFSAVAKKQKAHGFIYCSRCSSVQMNDWKEWVQINCCVWVFCCSASDEIAFSEVLQRVVEKCFNLIRNSHLCVMERAKLALFNLFIRFKRDYSFLLLENPTKFFAWWKFHLSHSNQRKVLHVAVHMLSGVWWRWSTTSFSDFLLYSRKNEQEENLISPKMPKMLRDSFPPANTTHKF